MPGPRIGLSAATIAENNAIGAVIGTLSATDPDSGDSFTYELVDGTGSADNAAFTLSGNQLAPVATRPAIALEPGSGSNARGTIAMARGAATDSATSQFFFNVQANPALDGNYVVFGAVVGAAGLAALDAMGGVAVYDCLAQLGAAFGELPLTAPSLDRASLVLVNGVTLVSD